MGPAKKAGEKSGGPLRVEKEAEEKVEEAGREYSWGSVSPGKQGPDVSPRFWGVPQHLG
jgi:hypothetical protein